MPKSVVYAFLVACSSPAANPAIDAAVVPPDIAVDAASAALPQLAFCTIADPSTVPAAFIATTTGDAVSYTCATPCADPRTCAVGMLTAQGGPALSARGNQQIQLLAFVVDGMAGHFAFTPDGDDVVITHAGAGGTSTLNRFDRDLQATSTLKTVSLGWEPGTNTSQLAHAGGWFTRKDLTPTTIHDLVARHAAAITWVKDNFAVNKQLGTVGSSMGTVATLGAHVWYGLEPIIDYQMLIGGPGMWDVNAGCGKVHIAAGHCDQDVAPCTGNPNSSYGDNDPACGSDATNNCRVPTIMAPLATGSSYDNIVNYVGMTTACAPTTDDTRDPALDASSMASTVSSWSFHGRVDFVANEGGVQPPDADQGMGEGHMMYIYAALTGAKSWTDNEGFHHGDAWDGDPTLIAAAAKIVVAGMGH